MDIRTPFFNEYGRLRSGWRALIFLLVMTVVLNVSTLFLQLGFRQIGRFPRSDYVFAFFDRTFLLLSALIAGYFCTKFLEGLPWRALGLAFHERWIRDLVVGTIIGILSLTLAVAISVAAGGLRFRSTGSSSWWPVIRSVGGSGVLFGIAALAEEAIFRGYPLQTFARARLIWLGVLLTLVFFAIAHLLNPNLAFGFTFANTALAGLWLAIAYLRTRSLWFPLAVHWGWNWALGSLFGLPVSGLKLVSHPVVQGIDLGPSWLTGGLYGIEGGAAGTIALLISTIFVWRTRLVSATPEMMKLTSEEKPVSSSPEIQSISPTLPLTDHSSVNGKVE